MDISQKFLDIICTNTNKRYDLFSSYIEISKELKKLNLSDGSLLHMVSPYLETFSLDLMLTNGTLELIMNTGTKTISLSHFQPLDEVRTLAKEMEQFLDREHLCLTPFPDERFIQTVLNTEIGDIINLNNRTAILCTKAGNNYREFQRLFEGS